MRFAVFLGAVLMSGCGSDSSERQDGVIRELRSEVARVVPDVGESGRAVRSQQEFAFQFLRTLAPEENAVFSPYSLSTAFAMTTDAAAGQTLQEIQSVFAFGPTDEAFHRSADALALALEARNRLATADRAAQVLVASNDIWIREDGRPQPSFLDTLARYYGVGVHLADFEGAFEAARLAINAKVADDTRSLIPELLPRNSLDPKVVAVLTNALYFKAPWTKPFSPLPGTFVRLDGTSVEADMLHASLPLAYHRGSDFAAVNVPYAGDELALQLIVPDQGAYASVRAALSADGLATVANSSEVTMVDFALPKFEVKSTIPAKDSLEALGLVTPFLAGGAEFPKLESENFGDVFIKHVFHQATVAVDERGTEASAASAVVGVVLVIAPPEPTVVLRVDRPFFFAIRDLPTGAVLFLGQVLEP